MCWIAAVYITQSNLFLCGLLFHCHGNPVKSAKERRGLAARPLSGHLLLLLFLPFSRKWQKQLCMQEWPLNDLIGCRVLHLFSNWSMPLCSTHTTTYSCISNELFLKLPKCVCEKPKSCFTPITAGDLPAITALCAPHRHAHVTESAFCGYSVAETWTRNHLLVPLCPTQCDKFLR